MAVAEAASTNGVYKSYSSTNSTLATALTEVLDELDTQKKSMNNTQFVLTSDGTNFSFVAIVKGG